MPNPNPNTSGLQKAKWINTPTYALRIPAVFASQLLEIARLLDGGGEVPSLFDYEMLQLEVHRLTQENQQLQQKINELETTQTNAVQRNKIDKWYSEILPKLKRESGYKANSASKLIKSIEALNNSKESGL